MNELETLLRPFAKMVAEEIVKINAFNEATSPKKEGRQNEGGRELKRGLKAICEIFHCSTTKAWEIKNSGVIDPAIVTISSRMFLVDKDKAIESYENEMRKRGRRVKI